MTFKKSAKEKIMKLINASRAETLNEIRNEYTVMPRFMFHQPLDYNKLTLPNPNFGTVNNINRKKLYQIPGDDAKFGYSVGDDSFYDKWGDYDFREILKVWDKHRGTSQKQPKSVLDFGCSSGRVLRHFALNNEKDQDIKLFGCDIQAQAVESMRYNNWSKDIKFFTNTTIPHLPLPSNSIDLIYSFSVFTHTKYLWDMWLMELSRVLTANGLMIHTAHLENAWAFYYKNQNEDWVQENHTPRVYETPEMDVDYLYFGDAITSQVFWKSEVLKEFWGRYVNILEIKEPPEYSFQNWIIAGKK